MFAVFARAKAAIGVNGPAADARVSSMSLSTTKVTHVDCTPSRKRLRLIEFRGVMNSDATTNGIEKESVQPMASG